MSPTLILLAGVSGANHVLKRVNLDEREANVATYAAADVPLATGVVDAITRFVNSH